MKQFIFYIRSSLLLQGVLFTSRSCGRACVQRATWHVKLPRSSDSTRDKRCITRQLHEECESGDITFEDLVLLSAYFLSATRVQCGRLKH